MQQFAPAKVNLYLHITGKRPDGYHLLLTHVVFPEFGDLLTFSPSDLLTLAVQGEFAAECGVEDNLVLRAARLLQQHSGCKKGARITLEKNLPVGGGLGGGSADAAATLRGLNEFWELGLEFDTLLTLAEGLGADVSMCLYSEPLFASGIGEEIVTYGDRIPESTPPGWLVLVHPRVPLLTAKVFGLITREEVMARSLNLDNHVYHIRDGKNDLQRAAIAAQPLVGEVLLAMETQHPKPLCVRMTGSGACCFAFFNSDNDAQAYATQLHAAYPDWWVKKAPVRL